VGTGVGMGVGPGVGIGVGRGVALAATPLRTVTCTEDTPIWAPLASLAIAETVWMPSVDAVEFHLYCRVGPPLTRNCPSMSYSTELTNGV
jgi:hypothetical protein